MKRVLIVAGTTVVMMALCVPMIGCEDDDYAYVGGPGREGFTAPSAGPVASSDVVPDEDAAEPLPWEISTQQPQTVYGGGNNWWYWWW